MPKRKAPATAWKKGQSGNPKGRAASKLITDQLKAVLHEEVEHEGQRVNKMRLLAEAAVQHAIDGSAPHLAVILERLEGKVPNVNINADTPLDGLDTESLIALEDALRRHVARRSNGAAGGDEGETVH